MFKKYILTAALSTLISLHAISQGGYHGNQISVDYNNPREYTIGGISVSGARHIEESIIIMVSQLNVGDRIIVPGEDISNAINNLWKQGLFQNVKISITSIHDDNIYLDIELEERPRLAKFELEGARSSDKNKLEEKLDIHTGDIVTDNLLVRAENIIKNYYIDDGYLKPTVNYTIKKDTVRPNTVNIIFEIDRGERIRIRSVNIYGNEEIKDWRIKRLMENTRERSLWFIFSSSKFIREDFEEDKQNIIVRYNELGKRDATIAKDSVYFVADNRIKIDLHIEEGPTYYIRDVNWVGNTVYSSETLNAVMGMETGDVYNQTLLDKNLFMNIDGVDISSLYLDDGYLFFNLDPVEVAVEQDSIDLEIRIFEGQQARIRRVSVRGNTRTNDHVIMREIRTRPGQLFSRRDIIRSHREIAQLGYFDQETIDVVPKPNPQDGTVDLEYVVEEASSDQIELSGGWGGGRIIGTVGLLFNNFSTRNILNRDAWRPLPTGDGQQLSLRAQTYGRGYISYSLSFMEPWLGGKNPNAFSLSVYRTTHRRDVPKDHERYGYYSIIGSSIGLAKRLRFPDDFFFLRQSINYQYYDIMNSPIPFMFDKGVSNNLSYTITFGRNSIDAPLFPRSGSEVSLSLQLTPPYSMFSDTDYQHATEREKFKWLEYHKWKFRTNWYTTLVGDLILSTRLRFGFLGYYNSDIGQPPFERFYLGGDGLSGWEIDGREIIALRGYDDYSLTPMDAQRQPIGATVFNRYTAELRYPISLNPMATVYALGFVEAGNSWLYFDDFNPFNVKRSAGVGLRLFLPMFGLLGIDWGYGFDEIPGLPGANEGQFHFTIGHSID